MPHRYPKRSQYKYAKKPYRIRSWPAYETALRRRGDEIASVMAGGAYDTRRAYSTIEERPSCSPTKILILPRSNAAEFGRDGEIALQNGNRSSSS
ncbi:MAG: hypothetical protein V3R77_05780, partial [Candidatus Binatia bacterium]